MINLIISQGFPELEKKTALKLLKEYHTVENLSEHLDDLKGKMGEKIRDNIDQGLLSSELQQLLKMCRWKLI